MKFVLNLPDISLCIPYMQLSRLNILLSTTEFQSKSKRVQNFTTKIDCISVSRFKTNTPNSFLSYSTNFGNCSDLWGHFVHINQHDWYPHVPHRPSPIVSASRGYSSWCNSHPGNPSPPLFPRLPSRLLPLYYLVLSPLSVSVSFSVVDNNKETDSISSRTKSLTLTVTFHMHQNNPSCFWNKERTSSWGPNFSSLLWLQENGKFAPQPQPPSASASRASA